MMNNMLLCFLMLGCLATATAMFITEKGSTKRPAVQWSVGAPWNRIIPTRWPTHKVQWTKFPATPWVRINPTKWLQRKIDWTKYPATPWPRINPTKWLQRIINWTKYPATPWPRINATQWPNLTTLSPLYTEPTEKTESYRPAFAKLYADILTKNSESKKQEQHKEIGTQNGDKIVFVHYKNDNTVIPVLVIGVASCIVSMLVTLLGVYCILNRRHQNKVCKTRATSLPWRTLPEETV